MEALFCTFNPKKPATFNIFEITIWHKIVTSHFPELFVLQFYKLLQKNPKKQTNRYKAANMAHLVIIPRISFVLLNLLLS